MLRVVSHTCSNTEIVCALGCAEMLVGVDDHSDYPVEVVSNLPRIGPDLGVDVERVKRLEPDLVLTSLTVPGHEKVIEALTAAKLPLLVVEPKSLMDVFADVERIACALGVDERGRELTNQMRAETLDDAKAPGVPGNSRGVVAEAGDCPRQALLGVRHDHARRRRKPLGAARL